MYCKLHILLMRENARLMFSPHSQTIPLITIIVSYMMTADHIATVKLIITLNTVQQYQYQHVLMSLNPLYFQAG